MKNNLAYADFIIYTSLHFRLVSKFNLFTFQFNEVISNFIDVEIMEITDIRNLILMSYLM